MSHTVTRNLIHMVFATKHRVPLITVPFEAKLHAYMAGTVRSLDCFLHALGGVEDHVHLIFDLTPKLALSDFARKFKTSASKWAKANGSPEFAWQRGYGAFGVNQQGLKRAVAYVRGQKEHHAHTTFRDELEAFLKVHGMNLDIEFLKGDS